MEMEWTTNTKEITLDALHKRSISGFLTRSSHSEFLVFTRSTKTIANESNMTTVNIQAIDLEWTLFFLLQVSHLKTRKDIDR